jgi:putative isomerase
MQKSESNFLEGLRDRIDLENIPFTERGSRLLVMRRDSALYIRFAERWYKRDRQLSTWRNRPPVLDEIRFTDADGEPLSFTLTSYPHRLDFETRLGTFSLAFTDTETLYLSLPLPACGVKFRARVDEAAADRRGGVMRVTGEIRRNVVYTTNRPVQDNTLMEVEPGVWDARLQVEAGASGGLLLNLTPRIGFNRYVPTANRVFEAAGQRWHDWFSAAPPVDPRYHDQYLYAWWVMRAGLISSRFFMTREAMTPSKIHYVGVWQWDAYFHALPYHRVEQSLARDQLRVVLDHQQPNGLIPDAIHDEGTITRLAFPVEADVTKPPLLAWAAWKMHEQAPDREFLEEIYEPICRFNRWWFEENDPDGDGLCEYLHPFSSGLDDSPLWDEGVPVTSPDLNTYLYLQMEALERVAWLLGDATEARSWRERADALAARMLQKLWDPETGLFWAYKSERRLPVKTVVSLLPLMTGRLPRTVTDRLVSHLTDPKSFWSKFPIPTVALDDPTYNPDQMWRGPTWVNMNYLIIEGLERSGYHDLAAQLRQKTLDMVMNHADIYEYYHPETGARPAKAAPMFGWSAALFIELALQATPETDARQA